MNHGNAGYIGEHAFEYCNNLTNITIPDSITEIGESAFSCCESLTSITIPDSVTEMGKDVFSSCDSLVSIKLPSNMTEIQKISEVLGNISKKDEIISQIITKTL